MRYLLLCLLSAFALSAACEPTPVKPDGQTEAGNQDAGNQDAKASEKAPDTRTSSDASPDAAAKDEGSRPEPSKPDPTPDKAPDSTPDAATDKASTDAVGDKASGDVNTGDQATKTMSFFITSKGPGDGGNLGGLTGADAHCKKLAEAAGVMGKTWAAYLSSSKENAKDRIGTGPWYNAKGVMVAQDVVDLHGANNNLNKQTALDESGKVVNGRGDTPNRHDILTGSKADGTVNAGKTCADWTSNKSTDMGTVGHHDRQGGGAAPTSWNSAHDSRGCSQADLVGTGGDGLFYCFAK